MTTKYRPESILLISAFAMALTLSSPAFAQCVGGRCYVGGAQTAAQAPQPTVRVVYPCQTAQACRPCQQATFAPFGGFFRNLFGCGWQAPSCGRCTAQSQAFGTARGSESLTGVCKPCQAEAPAACSACDSCEECPVDAEPVEEAETYEATEAETDACSACEPVAPCGNVEDLTEIEAELIRLANAERGAVRCSLLAPDKNLFGWARLNSRLQASYCRTGHFSGASWEISGGGYRSAAGVIKGWIGSAPHKAILLRNGFTKAGASVYQGRDGRSYWTMVFGN